MGWIYVYVLKCHVFISAWTFKFDFTLSCICWKLKKMFAFQYLHFTHRNTKAYGWGIVLIKLPLKKKAISLRIYKNCNNHKLWRSDEEQTFSNKWYCKGDIFYCNETGFVFLFYRDKDLQQRLTLLMIYEHWGRDANMIFNLHTPYDLKR